MRIRINSPFSRFRWATSGESLGLGLAPGDRHYRAYVGPPEDFDLIAAMTFNLLTTLGLRQNHSVLDVGCGSLRVGRLLIPYLNAGCYTGLEPNKWLVDEGVRRETGKDQIRIKKARFLYEDSPEGLPVGQLYDFAAAQSIFSHAGPDLVTLWLRGISSRLRESGALAATFIAGDEDCREVGWVYPKCVRHRAGTMAAMARDAGLEFHLLDWRHPRQSWVIFTKAGFDTSWLHASALTWNAMMDRVARATTTGSSR